jgi:hypothetical protein
MRGLASSMRCIAIRFRTRAAPFKAAASPGSAGSGSPGLAREGRMTPCNVSPAIDRRSVEPFV